MSANTHKIHAQKPNSETKTTAQLAEYTHEQIHIHT